MNYDKRRKYYMVLDCETATLPIASAYDGNDKQKIAIAKPLIYDLGWQVIDRKGRVYSKKNFLISEIFSVPSIFNTAYYASKRPIYLEKLSNNEITLTDWNTAINYLLEDMEVCSAVGAYNSMFDFKKAIPFTEEYIKHLYSQDFYSWEKEQHRRIEYIISSKKSQKESTMDKDNFIFRNKSYPLFDLWGMSCDNLLNNDDYKQSCIDNGWVTNSGRFFKTSAETTYRFLKGDNDFIESHTAIDDAIIESEIFTEIVKTSIKKLKFGITYFPFRILGEVKNFDC